LLLLAGQSGGSLSEWQLDTGAGNRWSGTFDLPVDVNFVGFRASPDLEAAIGELRIRPQRIVPNLDRVAAYEVVATLSLARFVFLFHDGGSYPEGDGFWVRGSSRAMVSVVSRTGRLTTKVRLRLRSRWPTASGSRRPGGAGSPNWRPGADGA